MKRLIVCCDGTWQDLSTDYPTNVIKITQSIKPIANDRTPQILYYQEGIGTRNKFEKITGGAFGWGIDKEIQDAYTFLSLNYQAEENDEIYLFGFSPSAYTVRSLAGFIYCSGLLRPEQIRDLPKAYELYRDRGLPPSNREMIEYRQRHGENVPIKLLACWDSVGALGIPNTIPILSELINAKYKFHDTKVNRLIEYALHAVAIDERREVFNVTPMRISNGATTKLRQVWFPGDHGAVGGGDESKSGLSDDALEWIINEIKQLGLGLEFFEDINAVVSCGFHPDYRVAFHNQGGCIEQFAGIIDRNILNPDHDSEDQTIFDQQFFNEHIHLSTKRRWKLTQEPLYRPQSLLPYQQWFNDFVE